MEFTASDKMTHNEKFMLPNGKCSANIQLFLFNLLAFDRRLTWLFVNDDALLNLLNIINLCYVILEIHHVKSQADFEFFN